MHKTKLQKKSINLSDFSFILNCVDKKKVIILKMIQILQPI